MLSQLISVVLSKFVFSYWFNVVTKLSEFLKCTLYSQRTLHIYMNILSKDSEPDCLALLRQTACRRRGCTLSQEEEEEKMGGKYEMRKKEEMKEGVLFSQTQNIRPI